MNKGMRSVLGFVLRLGTSLLLLWWLMRRLQGGMEELGNISPLQLWPAALIFALSTLLGALQWYWILRHAGVEVGLLKVQQLYWIGLFCSNFLPSNVGGDLVKVGDLALRSGNLIRPAAATLMDRILGLAALVSLAILFALILGGSNPAGLPWWLLGLVALPVIGLGAVLLSGRMGALLVSILVVLRMGKVGSKLGAIIEELRAYRVAPLFVARLALFALLVQSLRVLTHIAVAHSMGIDLTAQLVMEFFVLIPILGVAIVLPLSFNGLGLREWVATRLMPDVGIAAENAFALELATYFVQVAVSLIGGVIFAAQMGSGKLGWRRPQKENGTKPASTG